MIQMPQRSVTRFFIPLIDVLTLLFCIYLLMPIVKPALAEDVEQLLAHLGISVAHEEGGRAIAIDATLVRLILVPAAMELLGDWNWWLPGWLDRFLPHVGLEGETPAKAPRAPAEPARA